MEQPVELTYPVVSAPLSPAAAAFVEAEVAAGRLLRLRGEGGDLLAVPFGPRRALPLRFGYEGEGPLRWGMEVHVIPGQAPYCARLVLVAPPGEAITAQRLRRLNLGGLLEEAVLLSALELDEQGRVIGAIRDRAQTVAQARRAHRALEREVRRRRRAVRVNQVSDETLREVARLYRQAATTGAPTQAVHERWCRTRWPISRSTAGRWVALARARGFLAAAPRRGVPGEKKED